MTRDEILKLEAGRELDALVATKVLGLMVDNEFEEPFVPALRDRYDEWGILPSYSTDIAAAWEVVEKLRMAIVPLEDPTGWACEADENFDIQYGWYEREVYEWARAETAPLAICRAALLAVTESDG